MSRNAFLNCKQALTDADISAAEQEIGIRMPAELKQQYLRCNGGAPDRRCWVRGEGWSPDCIAMFIPIRPIGATDKEFGKKNLQRAMSLLSEHLPPDFIPIANDDGGNLFCIDSATGSIYFYTMDTGETFNEKKKDLTSSLAGFVEGLRAREDVED